MGRVSLVGAGPGDPDLLTVRAVDRLKSADVIFHDGLVPPAVLALAPQARHVSVARRTGPKALSQDEVNRMMTSAARSGARVVRLKSGDPFVFGRGGEEVRALADAGVPVDVVPGVTTALGAPTLAGIPVTHRGVASGFLVVSGHDRDVYGPLLAAVVPGTITIVVLMGMAERAGIQAALVDAGWRPDTPVAIVMNASRPDEHSWFGTLADLAIGRERAPLQGAGVIVIGSVVALAGTARPTATFESEESTWQPTTIPRR